MRGWYNNLFRRLVLLAIGLPLLAVHAVEPEMYVGFAGHFKSERWFPVTVTSAAGAQGVTLQMIEAGYGMGGYERNVTAVYTAEQDPDTGIWHALVYASNSYRDSLLQAVIQLPDGTERVVESMIKGVDTGTTLLLVVTDTPESFSFLRMLEQGRRRVTLVVAQDAGLLQNRDWRDFAGVDAVVLDGPVALSASDQQALQHWVQQGGSVILTDRVWGHAGAAWGFGDRMAPEAVSVEGALLAGLLPRSDAVVSFERYPMILDDFVPVFGDADGTLVGTQDVGWGRVIALGFSWQSLTLRDRALQETVRRDIWSGVLGLLREAPETAQIGMNKVIPPEAQVKSLVWPILFFLVICAVVLGPVNWLVLRRMRRLEYTALTLPVGALLLSLLALGLGIVWRPRHVIVEELFVAAGHGQDVHWRHGASGVFSPGSDVYRVEAARPAVLLREARLHSWRSWGEETIAADTVYHSGREMAAMDGLAIGRWSMRFLQTTEVLPVALGLDAVARVVGSDRLEGTITNRSDEPIDHVHVVFQVYRVAVGRLAPSEVRSFVLDLDPDSLSLGDRCPNCGGYHQGGDPFVTRKGEDPLPQQLDSQGSSAVRWANAGMKVPTVVGLREVPKSFVEVSRQTSLRSTARRSDSMVAAATNLLRTEVEYRSNLLLAAPVEVDWSGSAYIPDGFAHVLHLPRVEPDADLDESTLVFGQHLQKLPARYQPAVVALVAAFRQQAALRSSMLPSGVAVSARIPVRAEAYLLPGSVPGTVMLEWDFGEKDEEAEREEHEVVLEVYDWEAQGWQILAQASSGLHPLRFATSSAFVMPGSPVVVLRQRLVTGEMEEVDPFLLHTHGVGSPRLQQTSLTLQVAPEGVPDV